MEWAEKYAGGKEMEMVEKSDYKDEKIEWYLERNVKLIEYVF